MAGKVKVPDGEKITISHGCKADHPIIAFTRATDGRYLGPGGGRSRGWPIRQRKISGARTRGEKRGAVYGADCPPNLRLGDAST